MIKKLAINFSALSLLQISNYLIPLITFPYLVRVLGPVNFGLANFAFAFLVYFNTIIDYGFHFSSTRDLAQANADAEKVNDIFNLTFFSRLLLLLPATALYFLIISLIPFFHEHILIYSIAYLSVIGNALFPLWFFQGIEKMFYITIFNISFKTIGVVAIFFFVVEKSDLNNYIVIVSLAALASGAASIIYIFKRRIVWLAIPKYHEIKKHLRNSFGLFSSQYLIMLYTSSNTFVLGLLAGNLAVGYFSAADKIRIAIQNIGGVAGQAIFPHISNLFKSSNKIALNFLNKYSKNFGLATLLISLLLFFFAENIVLLVLGDDYLHSVLTLKIIAFLPTVIFFSNVFGIQFMLGKGYDKQFTRIIFTGAALNLILLAVFVPRLGANGAALSMLLTECIVTTLTFIFFRKHKNEI